MLVAGQKTATGHLIPVCRNPKTYGHVMYHAIPTKCPCNAHVMCHAVPMPDTFYVRLGNQGIGLAGYCMILINSDEMIIIFRLNVRVQIEKEVQKMDSRTFKAVAMLARMYGVGETLNDWECLENDRFIRLMEGWTAEFLGLENGDIVAFFEAKIGK